MTKVKRGPQAAGPGKPPDGAAGMARPSQAETWDKLTVLDREPGKFLLARWKNVFIHAWASRADAAAVQRVQMVLEGKNQPRMGVRSSVSLIAEGLPLPTDEARHVMAEMLTDKAKEIACLAVVVSGSGFASSALRSMLTGMRIGSQPATYEMGVFGAVDELASWLLPRHEAKTGVKLDPARLGEVLKSAQSGAAASGPTPAPRSPTGIEHRP